MLDSNVVSLERIGNGLNSRVYKIDCDNTESYVGKFYFPSNMDKRDRLGVEYSSLEYLWRNGIRCIPKAIAMDRQHHCAIYEYVQGEKIFPDDIDSSDIDSAVSFLMKLNRLGKAQNDALLPDASEACFSFQDIVDNIYLRLKRLQRLESSDETYRSMHRFINGEFMRAFETIQNWSLSCYRDMDVADNEDLPLNERTLSPSDFGFHNALRSADNKIIFLDFEYFGWDDPAKMISDFLLHPAMNIGFRLKREFVVKILPGLEVSDHFLTRLKAVYPLFGLKWCTILLNEFLREDMNRRSFASTKRADSSSIRAGQLSKAKDLLKKIDVEYQDNKYFT